MQKTAEQLIESVESDVKSDVANLAKGVLLGLEQEELDQAYIDSSLSMLENKVGDTGKKEFQAFKNEVEDTIAKREKITNQKEDNTEEVQQEEEDNTEEVQQEEEDNTGEQGEDDGEEDNQKETRGTQESTDISNPGISGNMIPPGTETVIQDIGTIWNNSLGKNGIGGMLKSFFMNTVGLGHSIAGKTSSTFSSVVKDVGTLFSDTFNSIFKF